MNIFTKLLSLFSSPKENSEEKLNTNTSLKVSNELKDFLENEVAFGQTQHPELTDFADGVNTLEFLSKI